MSLCASLLQTINSSQIWALVCPSGKCALQGPSGDVVISKRMMRMRSVKTLTLIITFQPLLQHYTHSPLLTLTKPNLLAIIATIALSGKCLKWIPRFAIATMCTEMRT